MKTWNIIILAIIIFISSPLFAQQENGTDDIKALKEQLEELKASHEIKLNELESLIKQLRDKIEKKEQEDELQKLLEEASQLTTVEKKEEHNIGKKFHTGVRQQSGLNPNISVSGDFFAGISTANGQFIQEPTGVSYGNDRFRLRELELNFVAPLDPFTRGKSYFSITKEGIALEEIYMEWLNLPLNMNLKAGKFNAEYGLLNRYHDHALPQFDRPKVLVNSFSNLSMGGYGFAGSFLLHPLFWSDASNLDLSIVEGGSGQSFTDSGKYNLMYIGNLTNFYDINQNTFCEWRIACAAGHNDPLEEYMSYVGNFSFEVKWVPVDRAKYRLLDWKNEILFSRRETSGDPINTFGFYSSLQNKMNSRWWSSVRAGYSQLPIDKDQYEWDLTACVDYWQSEFVFLRLQYQHSNRNIIDMTYSNNLFYPGPYPKDHTFLLQLSWAMGPHKHEAY